jgi:RsiW-degrading membrane proteinase PrsW (M82 family)
MENISPESGGPSPTIYAKVIHDQQNQKTIIQYWLFYYYNDWFNKHEGDWELVQVILDESRTPEWVVLGQHHGGTRRSWENVQIENDTHPAVFVALGSHANYFWDNETFPNGLDIGNTRLEIFDRTGLSARSIPKVILLPSAEKDSTEFAESPTNGWLFFGGRWGESSTQSDFGGPLGPSVKGIQWDNPYEWGISQPLDTETWYPNRLKIQIESTSSTQLTLEAYEEINLPALDIGNSFLIYHEDIPENSSIKVKINGIIESIDTLKVSFPNPADGTITKYQFDLDGRYSNSLYVDLKYSGDFKVTHDGNIILPTETSIHTASWDAPDPIWFSGFLPANQILVGILLSLAAGVIPGLVFVFLVYKVDHFEREPYSLLLATFLWGAIPAILVALVIPLFFSLPPELLGPEAIEAVRTGIFSPLVEESIKGIVIVFISIRFRKEFDDILDGIIYGAFVGLGFAVTGNTISYLGSFLIRGFTSLGSSVFIEGLLFGLNHALYSSIFGAGLGYSRLHQNRIKRWLLPSIAFLIAVAANGFHGLVLNEYSGYIIWDIILNWLGIITMVLIMMWSLKRQQDIIVSELKDVLSPLNLQILISRQKTRALLRNKKKQAGKKARKNLDHQLQLLTKLAFKKNQAKLIPKEQSLGEINSLRKKIVDLNLNTGFLDNEIDSFRNKVFH